LKSLGRRGGSSLEKKNVKEKIENKTKSIRGKKSGNRSSGRATGVGGRELAELG